MDKKILLASLAVSFLLFSSLAAATTDEIGSNSGNGEGGQTGYQRINKIVATASGTLTTVGVNVQTAAGNIRLGIYDSVVGVPTNLIAESDSTAVSGTGWLDISVSGAASITEGETYWLAIQADSGTYANYLSTPSSYISYKSKDYGAFDTVWVGNAPYSSAGIYYMRMTYAAETTTTTTTTTSATTTTTTTTTETTTTTTSETTTTTETSSTTTTTPESTTTTTAAGCSIIDATAPTYCLDSEREAKKYNVSGVECFESRYCAYGCDSVTQSCSPNPFYAALFIVGLAAIVTGAAFYFYKKR